MIVRGPYLLAITIASSSCYYASDPGFAGTSDGVDAAMVTSTEFPCEVAQTLSACWSCHADPPRGGAPMALTTRAHFTAMSSAQPGATVGQRAVLRMRDSARPMPPSGIPGPSGADIAAFEAWVTGGMPAGTCEGVDPPQPGEPAMPAMTVCSSGQKFPVQFDDGSPDMNPGLACRSCHLQREPEEARFFMGTVYPTLHEQDRCYSNVPAGTRVEILDANGTVTLTMMVRSRGNFMSTSRNANVPLPFTARVVSPTGGVTQMMTPQMTGDCNGCHTEQGANGAPGRILLPSN